MTDEMRWRFDLGAPVERQIGLPCRSFTRLHFFFRVVLRLTHVAHCRMVGIVLTRMFMSDQR